MDIKVKNCSNCPFFSLIECFGDSHNYCRIYKDGDNKILRVEIEEEGFDEIIYPHWCPLKQESVEIYLDK